MIPARNRPVLVLRPEPGNTATCRAAQAHGLHAYGAPLFTYAPRDWVIPAGDWAGLLIGSAAVFAHGRPALAELQAIPVHAVGPATARAAHNAGFAIAETAAAGLRRSSARYPRAAIFVSRAKNACR